MFENVMLICSLALFALVAILLVLAFLILIVRGLRRRPGPTPDASPLAFAAPLQSAPADPLQALHNAARPHMEQAIYQDLGKTLAEKWKTDMAGLLGPPRPPAAPPPNG